MPSGSLNGVTAGTGLGRRWSAECEDHAQSLALFLGGSSGGLVCGLFVSCNIVVPAEHASSYFQSLVVSSCSVAGGGLSRCKDSGKGSQVSGPSLSPFHSTAVSTEPDTG